MKTYLNELVRGGVRNLVLVFFSLGFILAMVPILLLAWVFEDKRTLEQKQQEEWEFERILP